MNTKIDDNNFDSAKEEGKIWIGAKNHECFGADGQIDIHKDEELEEVMANVNGWTKVRNKRGDVGLVPTKLLGKIL